MKNFFSLRTTALVFAAWFMISTADADLTFLGVAAGDAATNDVIVWTRAKDESNPQSTDINVQITTDPTFTSGVSTMLAGTATVLTDYTVKADIGSLDSGTIYYYRFQTTDGLTTSNVGKFKTAPDPMARVAVRFGVSGDCDGLIRPYALASRVPEKNLDFFMFDGDTEYETSASIGSPAVTSTGNIPNPSPSPAVPTATHSQLFGDFSRKYREQFLPVNVDGQNCLQPFFAGQGNYTAYDNHELGNKQYINGGAPAGDGVGSTTGLPPFDFPTGAGVDARNSANDVTPMNGPFMNKSMGFQTLQQVYLNYQPVKDRGVLNLPGDPRTNGTRQLFFAQQWGRNVIFINTDDRTYRDIRMKTAANADDTGPRADNPNRNMIGPTQLAWLEQTLLAADEAGTIWKFINISDPIDQIGPIGGTLTLVNPPTQAEYGTLGSITSIVTTAATNNSTTITVNSAVGLVVGQGVSGAGVPANTVITTINTNGTTFRVNNNCTIASGATLALTPAPSTYAPVNGDGGKSWMGEYRSERNALLKFIADHQIYNVVFLATDDHQNRINELLYSPSGQTGVQSSYVKVPYCFEIVCGPLGATGPDLISNHSFSLVKKLADSIANAQINANLEPIGLAGYPGLNHVTRFGDPDADELRQPADFYSPDTFNYNVLDVSADGKRLTVTSYGINSTVQNGFVEYDPINNPEQALFSFRIQRHP